MDDASVRLARVDDWLRVARSGVLGHRQITCTWAEVADDLEFYVYPERSTDGEADADADREGQQQAEAGSGVGPGPAESVREADGELTDVLAAIDEIGREGLMFDGLSDLRTLVQSALDDDPS